MRQQEKDDLIVQAAWLYYNDGLTQAKIAKKLNLSRVSVNRMLGEARQRGIVQIRITRPRPAQLDLENKLERGCNLEMAIVVKTAASETETLQALGQAGADHLMETLSKGCRLGIGWSSTVSYLAPYLQEPKKPYHCTVNELAGSMLGLENPYSISARIAQVLGIPVETLPVPAIVQNPETRTALLKESAIRRALENAALCDVAFVGLGEVGPQNTMVRTGSLTSSQMRYLRKQGAVGEILLRYFDGYGLNVPTPIDDRIISLAWENIQQIPYLVVMAAGRKKLKVLQGAIRGRLIDCLITDTETAQMLLTLQDFQVSYE